MVLENPINDESYIRSGDVFKETGCYSYVSHVEDHKEHCFNPPQTNRMFFKRGETAPKLISCQHDIFWKLIFIS